MEALASKTTTVAPSPPRSAATNSRSSHSGCANAATIIPTSTQRSSNSNSRRSLKNCDWLARVCSSSTIEGNTTRRLARRLSRCAAIGSDSSTNPPSMAGAVSEMNASIVITTISLASAIVAEATLSFLGVGLPSSTMSWGNDISQAQTDLRTAPQVLILPSIALSVTVLSFIMLGEVVRDALDPKARAQR